MLLSQNREEFVVVSGNDTVETHVFTLNNTTKCSVRVDPASWSIERSASSGWSELTSGPGEKTKVIPSEHDHRWSLSLQTHPTTGPRDETRTFVFPEVEMPEGRYAFVISGTLETPDSEEPFSRRAEFVLRKETATPSRE